MVIRCGESVMYPIEIGPRLASCCREILASSELTPAFPRRTSAVQLAFHVLTERSLRSNHAVAGCPNRCGVIFQYVHAAPGFAAWAMSACGLVTAIRTRLAPVRAAPQSVVAGLLAPAAHQYCITQTKMLYCGE